MFGVQKDKMNTDVLIESTVVIFHLLLFYYLIDLVVIALIPQVWYVERDL